MKIAAFLLLFLTLSCSPRQIHKIQSDKRIKKTEDHNFTGPKAPTQWWYYDCIFDDGSVLVLLFTPFEWWDEAEKMPTNKSLFYFSYMNAKGEVKSQRKVFDASIVQYNQDSIMAPNFEIIRAHDPKSRNYTINFSLDSLRGGVQISSEVKAFSPFPRGSMSAAITKLFKRKVKGLAYRYAAHVPQGRVNCNLEFSENRMELKGKAYHEQGWFTGSPECMGNGWSWFHFVSKNMNIFGTPGQFFCLEHKGKRLAGGLEKKCYISDITVADKPSDMMTGGKIEFKYGKLSFNLTPREQKGTPLICLPSSGSQQLWGTAIQKTAIRFSYKGEELQEDGLMFLETCRMRNNCFRFTSNSHPGSAP